MRWPAGAFGTCANRPATMLFSKSTDGGAAWSAPVTIATVMLSAGSGYYGNVPGTGERLSDIPVIDIDNSAGPRAGRPYVAFYTSAGGLTHVQVSTSADGGVTWSPPVAVFPTQTQSTFFSWLSVSQVN